MSVLASRRCDQVLNDVARVHDVPGLITGPPPPALRRPERSSGLSARGVGPAGARRPRRADRHHLPRPVASWIGIFAALAEFERELIRERNRGRAQGRAWPRSPWLRYPPADDGGSEGIVHGSKW